MMLRPIMLSALRTCNVVTKYQSPIKLQRFRHDEVRRPFENLPFTIKSRYTATLMFIVFFGTALWSPFAILWYMMAKRTM